MLRLEPENKTSERKENLEQNKKLKLFKLNKLILYYYSNSFIFFKSLKNFDYILFYFIFFMVNPNIKKSFSLIFFSFLNIFRVLNIALRFLNKEVPPGKEKA